MSYGILPTGYSRKPLSVILAEIEALMQTEFGSNVIQTSQSPFGQLNGLQSDLIEEVWERNEELYQSIDVDQAEGNRLDILGRLRKVSRGSLNDADYRRAITNAGAARIDVSDITSALTGLDGVTYAHVFVNATGETKEYKFERATIVAAVEGGNEDEIASVLRNYVLPGISTYGNYQVSASIDGYCRAINIIRPIDVPVILTIYVNATNDRQGCPPPSSISLRDYFINQWDDRRVNGRDITKYTVRSILEGGFPNIEIINISASRDGMLAADNVDISFIEMASFATDNVTIDITYV